MAKRFRRQTRRKRRKRTRRRKRRGAGFLSSTRKAPRACARAIGNFLNRKCKLDKFAFPTTREKEAQDCTDQTIRERETEGYRTTAAERQLILQNMRELLRHLEKEYQCPEQPVGVDGEPLFQLGSRPTIDHAGHMERQLAAFHGLSGGRRTRRRRRRRRSRRRRRTRRRRRRRRRRH